ncbi:uncharacterized protein LOC124360620 [Homalodisca vitripennis]|uniref:uncharacterized protein LOC124360620 n=1 Tax=Homalodisca vitripennis TaxID=197043 RepID=UPI001EE9AF9A|nr:uncharacterized protein LOC124360620 [Homalodisca vitripennis]
MEVNDMVSLKIEIPFPSQREANIVYHSLRVDIEPTRKQIKKIIVSGRKQTDCGVNCSRRKKPEDRNELIHGFSHLVD